MSIQIGGDTTGIRALAKSMDDYRSRVQTVYTTLDKVTDNLVHDAGWQGDAADTFRNKWEFDAAAAATLDGLLEVFSNALGNLATGLDEAHGMFANAVNAADAEHLTLCQDGNVLAQVVPASQVAALNEAKATYLASVKAAQERAQQARGEFAVVLQVFISGLGLGNPKAEAEPLYQSDYAGLASMLRDYVFTSGPIEDNLKERLTATAEKGGELADELDNMEDPSSKAGLKEFDKLLKTGDRWKKIQSAVEMVHTFNEKLEKSPAKIFDRGILAAAEDDAKQGGKFAKFLEDVPGLDMAFTAWATEDMARRDHDRGWSWTHAIVADGAANLTGLAVGTAVNRVPWIGPIAGPVLGYASSAAVTEWTHNVEWDQNIHDHGVVAGTLYSIGEGEAKTWDNDFVGVASKLWHMF
jgi:uncharacterized protein YukE